MGGNLAIERRGYLYRYMTWDRAVDVFQRKRLFFARPGTWTDPYEVQLRHRASDMLFAQCWCRTAISDAMWRIYGGQAVGDTVRIGIKKERLEAAIGNWARQNGLQVRARRVEYKPAEIVRERVTDLAASLQRHFDLKLATDALFLKREAFRHENEWRIVLYGEHAGDDGVFIPIEPLDLIETVLLDPRATKQMVDRRGKIFREEFGYERTVRASAIDRPPAPINVD